MNGNPSHSTRRLLLTGLVLVVCIVHLGFSLYYITHAEGFSPRPTLQGRDEEFLKSFPSWGEPHEVDMAAYNRSAISILKTGVPRNLSGGVATHAMVYYYFLAACYGIGGVQLLSIAVPQALFAGLTALFIALAASRVDREHAWLAAIFGGVLYFVNARMAVPVAFMIPATVLFFWVAVAVYAATRIESPRNLVLFVCSIVVAVYTQGAFFVVASGAAVWLFLVFLRTRRRAYFLGALFIAGGIGFRLCLPHLDTGGTGRDNVTAAVRGGILYEANNPCYESMSWFSLWEQRPGSPRWQLSATDEERYHAYLKRTDYDGGKAALLWICEHPVDYVKLCWVRLCATLGPFTGQMSPRNKLLSACYWLMIFPAGWYGLWQMRKQRVAQMALWVFLALTTFEVLVITEWYLRYRMPWEVVLTVFAAVGYARLLSRWRGQTKGCPSNPTDHSRAAVALL